MNIFSSNAGMSADAHFVDRFGVRLPPELRERADRVSWDSFVASFGQIPGPVRLGQWTCLDNPRPASRLGPQSRTYRASITIDNTIGTCVATASGPVAALTTMLHERRIAVEMLRFHQFGRCDEAATFIHGSNGRNAVWAVGLGADPAQSALDAVIGCANRLLTAA